MKHIKFTKTKDLYLIAGFILPLFISILTFREILFSPGIIQHGDLGYPIDMKNSISYNLELWNQWMQSFNHHLPKLWLVVPLSSLLAISSSEIIMKLFPFTIFFISGVSMYFSISILLNDEKISLSNWIASSVSSLLFMINPWTLHMIHHMEWLVLGYGILPLSLSLFNKILNDKKNKPYPYFLIVILLSLVFTQVQTAFYVMIPFIILFFFQLGFRMNEDQTRKKTIFKCLKRSMFIFVLLFVVNAFWLLPYLFTLPYETELPFKTLSIGEVNAASGQNPITYILSLFSLQFTRTTDVSYSLNHPILDTIWFISGILIAIFAFLSVLIVSDKPIKKWFHFFGLLSIISIALSMGTLGPLGKYYYNLVISPLGWVFRDPTRIIGLVVYSLSSLIGLGLNQFLSNKVILYKKKTLDFNFKIIIVFLLIVLILFHGWPSLTGNFNKGFVSMVPPSEYQDIITLLGKNPYERIYWQPADLRYTWDPTLHIGKNIGALSSYNSIFGYNVYGSILNQYFYYDLLNDQKTDNFGKHLAPINVKYVVWHKDLISPYNEIAEKRINSLLFQKDLSIINDGEALIVFKNDRTVSPISIPKEIYLVNEGLSAYNELISLPMFNPQEIGVIFSAYLPLFLEQNEFQGITVVGSETTVNDMTLLFIDPQFIIEPFDYTSYDIRDLAYQWCRENTLLWYRSLALPNNINNWDFDFQVGIVATSKTGAELEIPINIKDDGIYDLSIRFLENSKGGTMEILVDGETSKVLNCSSETNQFVYKRVTSKHLPVGKHKITLRNIDGLSIVNFLTLTPAGQTINYSTSAERILNDTNNLILLNIDPLYDVNKELDLEIPKDSEYKISLYPIDTIQNLTVLIDGITVENSDFLELKSGEHTLRVAYPEESSILTNCEILDGWSVNQPGYVKLSTLHTEGNYSIESDPKAWMKYTLPKAMNFNEYEYLSLQILETTSEKIMVSLIDQDETESASIELKTTEIWSQYVIEIPQFNNSKCDLTNVKELMFHDIYGDYVINIDDIELVRNIPNVDKVIIYSTENQYENLQDFFTLNTSPAEIIEYRKMDATSWKILVNATKPFMLSFTETYDPLWIAHINGERIDSIPLYSEINGFWINQTGQLEITLQYEPQKWFNYGLIISVTTFVVCLAYLTHIRTKDKEILKRITGFFTRLPIDRESKENRKKSR